MVLSLTILFGYDVKSVWVILPVLIGLAIVTRIGWKLIWRYRQRMLGDQGSDGPWTLGDLEQLRDSGRISEQEFKVLRDVAIRGAMAARLSRKSGKSTPLGNANDK
jgi:hypothetical protein